MSIKVAINGFGRIGRCVLRAIHEQGADVDIDVVAINDLTDSETLAHLLKYDSIHGIFNAEVNSRKNSLFLEDKEIKIFSERDPANLPWKELGIDVVIEATGLFTKREGAQKHIDAGAKKVIITAPATDPDVTIVLGVNFDQYDSSKHHIISNASCTTNCLAPVAKVIDEKFGILHGLMTTTHSYTNDQKILDLPHKDVRRARAAGLSLIPTSTGAAKAVGLVLPQLVGKLDGLAIRVPTPNVSIVDLTVTLSEDVTVEKVNAAIREAAESELKGILKYETEELVSIDFKGSDFSSIFDSKLTKVVEKRMLKVFSWYDNEWGYSYRIADLIGKIL